MIKLGEKIGEGGEGIVYVVADRPGMLAKIAKDPEGLEPKLNALLALRSNRLTTAGAWPVEPVLDASGKTVGYVMEYYPDTSLLHTVFQTKSRVKILPHADYSFLIRVAKNLATCVHLVHADGLVVGDLNESNVLVSGNALVRLIDCDSFQVSYGEFRQTCDVGKGEMLPPELQGTSLAGKWRTQHQDLFPLAVLIFQILMLGRHPFAGRASSDEDVPLEDAIRRGWYAYSDPATPLTPPPGITLGWLPPEIRDAFQRSFTLAPEQRTSAVEWHGLLDRFEGQLAACPNHGRHTYWRMVESCPWCALEDQVHVLLFASPHTADDGVPSSIDGLATRIKEEVAEREWHWLPSFHPRDLSWGELWAPFIIGFWVVHAALRFSPWPFWTSLALSLALCMIPATIYLRHYTRWKARRKQAAESVDDILRRWERLADPATILAESENLLNRVLKSPDYDSLLEERRREILTERYRDDLDAHLRKYSIHSAAASIPVSRLDQLHANRLRTAADIVPTSPPAGLSDIEWGEIVGWQQAIIDQFWASTTADLSTAEDAYLRQRTRQDWKQLVAEFESETERLIREADRIEADQQMLLDHYAVALQPLVKHPGAQRLYMQVTGRALPVPTNDRLASGSPKLP